MERFRSFAKPKKRKIEARLNFLALKNLILQITTAENFGPNGPGGPTARESLRPQRAYGPRGHTGPRGPTAREGLRPQRAYGPRGPPQRKPGNKSPWVFEGSVKGGSARDEKNGAHVTKIPHTRQIQFTHPLGNKPEKLFRVKLLRVKTKEP